MGKDNLIFHTIFWPGQLIGFDKTLHLPDIPAINMFLDLDGNKFSKSRGVVVEIKDIVEKFGNDRVRFYLTLIMPEERDSSFSWLDFKEKVNGILVDNIGNFVHRTLSLGYGIELDPNVKGLSPEVIEKVGQAFSNAKDYLDRCEFRNYLDTIIQLSGYGNKLCNTEVIWQLKKTDSTKFKKVLQDLYLINLSLAYLISPLLPEASEKLLRMLNINTNIEWPVTKEDEKIFLDIVSTIKLMEQPQPLFQKIEEI